MKTTQVAGISLSIALSLGAASSAFAQDSNSKIKASVDGAFVLPTGDWADISGPGLGVVLRGSMQIQDKLELVGRAAYVFHFAKDVGGVDASTTELMLLGGVRYDAGPVYLDAATGLNFWTLKVEGGGFSGDETETRIPLLLGASLPVSNLEIGGHLLLPNFLLQEDGEDTAMGLMATVGYRFL